MNTPVAVIAFPSKQGRKNANVSRFFCSPTKVKTTLSDFRGKENWNLLKGVTMDRISELSGGEPSPKESSSSV
jgi:hypothetical protein